MPRVEPGGHAPAESRTPMHLRDLPRAMSAGRPRPPLRPPPRAAIPPALVRPGGSSHGSVLDRPYRRVGRGGRPRPAGGFARNRRAGGLSARRHCPFGRGQVDRRSQRQGGRDSAVGAGGRGVQSARRGGDGRGAGRAGGTTLLGSTLDGRHGAGALGAGARGRPPGGRRVAGRGGRAGRVRAGRAADARGVGTGRRPLRRDSAAGAVAAGGRGQGGDLADPRGRCPATVTLRRAGQGRTRRHPGRVE